MGIVINGGVPGDSSKGVLEKLPKNLEEYAPETVVMSVGANDAVNPRMFVGLPDFEKNLNEIIDRINAYGAKLVLLVPPYIHFPGFMNKYPEFRGPLGDGIAEKYLSYVNVSRRTALERRVPNVDMYGIFQAVGMPGDSPESLVRNKANCGAFDGVHPTPHGHILIGALVRQTMLDFRMPSGRVACLGDSITHGYPLAGMGTVEGDNYPSVLNRLINRK